MSSDILVLFVRVVSQTFIWVVIASSLLSFVLSPYHPVREALDRILAPFLNPIRSIMPNSGMIDFSPLILILIIEFLSRFLITLLS
ncbi:MAG TPA: YggT family protein [Anaerolineales bacterium]|nr:YggT family protein [Anaerolineales bacterium]HNO32474.1 YggT family protein [Anaerolineales bacterium]